LLSSEKLLFFEQCASGRQLLSAGKMIVYLTVRQRRQFVIFRKNECFSNSAPAAAICYPQEK
jgi:hypothetical protein